MLFEIIDALLLSPPLTPFPELTGLPIFRRQWPSLYEGLADGEVDQAKSLETLTAQLPETERPLLVGDDTTWARPQARTLEDRSFQHQPADQGAEADHHQSRLQHARLAIKKIS